VKVAFTILGEPASKANSREIALVGPKDKKRVLVRKGDKALSYERDALRQLPPTARLRLEGPVAVTLRIFYASERPDLDESIVLDVLQDRWGKRDGPALGERGTRVLLQAGVYRNDRQVREKHVYHAIDRVNPRAEIVVEALQAQQTAMPQALFDEAEVPF
jgi:hypothetical protein